MTRKFWAGALLIAALTAASASQAQLFGNRRNQPTVPEPQPQIVQPFDTERVDRLEAEVRDLTGKVEELTFQLQLMQDQLRRAGVATGPAITSVAPPTTIGPGPAGLTPPAAIPPGAPPDAVATLPANPGTGARLGPLPSEGQPSLSSQPLDLSALARGTAGGAGTIEPAPGAAVPTSPAPVQQAALPPTGDPKIDYDRAYNLILSGRYDTAETAFRQFLATYPKSDLAPDAQYWLGESLFERVMFDQAAVIFREAYKTYPKSQRAPDTLLKLGLSLAGMGQRQEACQIYAAALKQHPDMSNALKARVVNEQASAAC